MSRLAQTLPARNLNLLPNLGPQGVRRLQTVTDFGFEIDLAV